MKELFTVDALVMTKRLQRALRSAGVDNIDFYETVVSHPTTGFSTSEYVAGNLVGIVAAVDLAKSGVVGGSLDRKIDTDFDSVVLRREFSPDLPMFRLAENTSAIVVQSAVRDRLLAEGFDQLTFLEPEEWMG
jgi:hypothetical protein